ncbi:hypothetical protein BDY19DRAFT_1045335 [Irpex rosettiformis]|uniref:Uncharacterized protein n=1 Tax=Irpex rosettiformis TaxID=378272 RepID=A0ACB8UH64_9APHY|nr:hypothetical protein BDY19DRAFT_1045335 [Irpex rosettiformis]
MSRRSARIKRLREDEPTVQPSVAEEINSDGSRDDDHVSDTDSIAPESDDEPAARPKKAASKGVTRAPRRRAGKLREMLDMPLDVILEICSHLHPKDVLNLSRTSKDLRKFLMNRSSKSFWLAALSNLPNLPPCPGDLSEPAYVNLMFSIHCHGCLKKNCQDVYWVQRMRLCDACIKNEEVLGLPFGEDQTIKMIQPRKLSNFVPVIRHLYKSHKHPRFYGPAVNEFVASLKDTPVDKRDEFLRSREELIELREESAPELARYLRESRYSRAGELEKQRIARRDEIVERLKQAGYEEDVNYLFRQASRDKRRSFIMMPEVRKTQALTPKIWNNIKEQILGFMDGVREIRLAAIRKSMVFKRLDVLSRLVGELSEDFRPRQLYSLEVAFSIPRVIAILDPYVEKFDAEELKHTLEETIPTYIADREKQGREGLRSFIKKEFDLNESTDPFSLAAVVWLHCRGCNLVLTHFQASQHCCPSQRSFRLQASEDMNEEYCSILTTWNYGRSQAVWAPQYSHYYSYGIDSAVRIIEKCGLDPKTATVHDMDVADVKFVCLGHPYYAPIMGWRAAIHHSYPNYHSIRRATETELTAMKPLEIAREKELVEGRKTLAKYRCGRCNAVREVTKDAVDKHLREVHDVTKPDEDDCLDLVLHVPAPVQTYFFLPGKTEEFGLSTLVKSSLESGVGMYFDYLEAEETTPVS